MKLSSWENRSGCLDEVGDFPPQIFTTPREHYRALRMMWAQGAISSPLLNHPFGKIFPLSSALISLFKKNGSPFVPTKPQHLHFSELCQLSLLWALAGFHEEGEKLAQTLLPDIGFSTLWCPEEEYDEKEIQLSFDLLLHAFGMKEAAAGDPFFTSLSKKNIRFAPIPFLNKKRTLPLTGEKATLGQIRMEGGEIRAFGPQVYPLNDPKGFGISNLDPSAEWIQCAGAPEVWVQIKITNEEIFDLHFIGIESPLPFVFYIKAAHCKIGGHIYKPKSLHRYAGGAKLFEFHPHFRIESSARQAELIPLAGEGGFWDSDFLLSFEISPHDPHLRFAIK